MKHFVFALRAGAFDALALIVLTLATSARANVTNVAWYRLGENDPGAASGQSVNSATMDFVGANPLRRSGSARYTNDVSLNAGQIGSTLAVFFGGAGFCSNAVVSTARNNFGIEAWVRTLTAANGTYLIAHNGSLAANGWGLQVQVTNQPLLGLQIIYSGELGGGIRVGAGTSRSAAAWAHVALVRDNGTSTFYLNGEALSGPSTATPATPAGVFSIAGSPSAPSTLFPGSVDEVRVFTFAPGQFSAGDLLVNQAVATTLEASGLAPGTVTLQGRASSIGFPTAVWFEWGPTTNLGNTTTPQVLGNSVVTTNFSEVLTGLAAGGTYFFRAVGTNRLGLVQGSVRSVTLGPLVFTLPADLLGQTTATLNGEVDPRGSDTRAWFEFGFTTNYGNVTPPQALGSGDVSTNFSQTLTGLLNGVSYHFRAVGSNALGIQFGADQSFPDFAQQVYLKASHAGVTGRFGDSGGVAMSGDTLVVGALEEGAVYVFVRVGDAWVQQAVITNIPFSIGSPLAISGDTIVLGVPSTSGAAPEAGAVHVYVRNGTNWSFQAILFASERDSFDRFGDAVAVSGDTIVVGVHAEDSNATGINGNEKDNSAPDAGAAYVFVRSGTTWTQQAYLKASNTARSDLFGAVVAVSGDTIVVGAPGEDSSATGVNGNQADNSADFAGAAYVFVRNGTNWTQQAYLKASNTGGNDWFGFSVAAAGDTIVVGAPNESSSATGVNGNQTDNSAAFSGAAYVFVRNGTNWTQQAYLKASNTDADDGFGDVVSVSADTIVVGAPRESSNATGINGDQNDNSARDSGAAYRFVRSGTTWTQQAYLKASNTEAEDAFGSGVAVSGDFIAVGAPLEASSAVGINGDQTDNGLGGAGAGYVFGPPLPPFAEINVSFSGTNLLTGGNIPAITMVVGASSNRNLTIKNSGAGNLSPLAITFDGPDAALFTVPNPPAAPLAPNSGATFAVRFAPTSSGIKTATLHIASNDADENPFSILLSFLALAFNEDQDGDGLSDAAEFQLAGLGFNFQTNQSNLVNALFNNLSGAVPNLNAIGFFTQSQVQALNVNSPLLAKDPNTGLFKLTIGVEKATLLTNFFPFPMTAPQTTINAEGQLEFQFSSPDNAAFFRLESR